MLKYEASAIFNWLEIFDQNLLGQTDRGTDTDGQTETHG